MGRQKRRNLGVVVLGVMPVMASAQLPLALDSKAPDSVTQQVLGGTPTLDIISLRADGPGAPLRFGNVIPKSERIQLNGRLLVADRDYAMDNAAGVVYLKVAQRVGDSLSVSYRYDLRGTGQSSGPVGGINGFTYSLLPGSMNMLMGMGMAERASDGSVLRSNVFGWNNTLKFGQTAGLSGLYIYADRQKTANQAGLVMDQSVAGSASTDEGKSQFLVQNFKSALLGGAFQVDYQDISKNFANFSSVKQGGYNDGDVNRFQAERGLKRTGFALQGAKFGGLSVSNTYRDIKDLQGGISWRSLAVEQGGVKLAMNSQRVDQGFQRFADISEQDKQQLMRERGMSRQSFSGEFARKSGTLSFTSQSISDDATSKGIERREARFETGGLKLSYGDQDIDSGFARVSSLTGQEQANWNREAGIKRQWLALDKSFGKDKGFSFNQSFLASSTGKFDQRSAAYVAKGWSLEQTSLNSSVRFGSMGAMQDAEADNHVRTIASMYGQNVQIKPEERGSFLRGAGIGRELTRFKAQPFKGFEAKFEQLDLQGANRKSDGTGSVKGVDLAAKNWRLSMRTQEFGKQFTDLSNLMELERLRLGTLAGLQRSDLSFSADLGKSRSVGYSKLTAMTAEGSVTRTLFSMNAKGLEVHAGARKVDAGMSQAGQLVDSENQFLSSLRGFNERDLRVKFDGLKNVKFESYAQEALNDVSKETRLNNFLGFQWTPDSKTSFAYARSDQKNSDPMSLLFANSVQKVSFSRDFGRVGQLQLVDEKVEYSGASGTTPDMHKQFLAYETKLNARTSIRTEQTRTDFENGDKEDISANTLSTQLNKRTGVSVTDVKIDRNGSTNDEAKRNVGLWYEFGNGLRLSYGYARHLNGETQGTANSTFTFGQNQNPLNPDQMNSVQAGTVGGVNVGGGYGVNRWEQGTTTRTQAFSNVSLSTAKALKLGPINDLKFNFGLDTAADYGTWLRENRAMGFSGRVGQNAFSYEYKGQMAVNGSRGIDRNFKVTTDPAEKNWIRGSIAYKVRTLPTDQQIMIRDFNITAKPSKNVEVTHLLQTNPEVFRGDAFLGSVVQASRSNEWRVDLKNSKDVTVGGTWKEFVNEQNNQRAITGGMNLKLFAQSGSPLSLFYGVEEVGGNVQRRLTQRYHVQFDQRPGINQRLSFFIGNVSYQQSIAEGFGRNNVTMRMDYQLRF